MKMTPEFVTIGVYGFDETGFFQALHDAGVDTFVDIRRRRGVRGAAYAFANSQRLQARLAELGIRYVYRPDLAPSKAVRQAQEAADKASKTAKRQRTELDPAFVEAIDRRAAGQLRQPAVPGRTGAGGARRRPVLCRA